MITATAEWQLYRAQECGAIHSEVVKRVAQLSHRSEAEISSMMQDAAIKSTKYDSRIYQAAGLTPIPLAQSPVMLQQLVAGMQKTNGVLHNLTMTTALTAQQSYLKASDLAYMQITSGAFDYNTAIQNAIQRASIDGLTVRYPSGHVDQLDVAVRRSVLTGVSQTVGKIAESQADEMGCDLVETTAHGGARPEHEVWQGKVFSRSGNNSRYPDFVKSTGYGTGAGLMGWNCRHSFFPFFEGIDSSAYPPEVMQGFERPDVTYNGKKMTFYEATQVQRGQERQIRKWKQQAVMLEAAGQDSTLARANVKEWQRRQREFTAQTGLKRQYPRERIETATRSFPPEKVIPGQTAKKYLADTSNLPPSFEPPNLANQNEPTERFASTSEATGGQKPSSALAEATTLEELAEYAKREWGMVDLDLDGLDIRAVKPVFEEIDVMIREFPALKGWIRNTSKNETYGIASVNPLEVHDLFALNLNPKYFSDVRLLRRRWELLLGQGMVPANTTFRNAGSHEMGHILSGLVTWKNVYFSTDFFPDWRSDRTSSKIVLEAWKSAKDSYPEGTILYEAQRSISTSAAEKNSETIADAVSDWVVNGDNAKPLSLSIIGILRRELS